MFKFCICTNFSKQNSAFISQSIIGLAKTLHIIVWCTTYVHFCRSIFLWRSAPCTYNTYFDYGSILLFILKMFKFWICTNFSKQNSAFISQYSIGLRHYYIVWCTTYIFVVQFLFEGQRLVHNTYFDYGSFNMGGVKNWNFLWEVCP